jgi:sugar lactone lactonase YvrE
MKTAWETAKEFKYPESVVYDPKRDVLYVSNYAVSGPGYISKIRVNGQIENLQWVTGLNRPTGLCMHDDRLFVVERTGLAEIDPETAEVLNRYPIPGARFPNDVTITPTGDMYVSGSASNTIFKRGTDGEFAAWLQDPAIMQPNGMLADGNRLLVGCSGDGTVKAVDLSSKAISTFATIGNGALMDGLVSDGNGSFIVGDNKGRLFSLSSDGEKTELLNTTVVEMNCADLAFIPSKNLIVVPTWVDHRVVAFEYEAGR